MSLGTAILEADRSAFLAINGAHHPWADAFFWQVSRLELWIPLYVFFLVLLQRRWGWRGLAWAVPVIGLMVLCTDTGSVVLFKNTVQRLRPSHAADLQGLVHLVRDENGQLFTGGAFGFVSSHASNHFGIASFMVGILQNRPRWALPLLFGWAGLIAFSRVYLGVHYPGDVIVGGIYGAFVGLLAYRLFLYIHQRFSAP